MKQVSGKLFIEMTTKAQKISKKEFNTGELYYSGHVCTNNKLAVVSILTAPCIWHILVQSQAAIQGPVKSF